MERMQLEQGTAARARLREESVLGLSSQEVRLTNGRYSVTLSAIGSGESTCDDFDVSRRVPDPICDGDGFHLFLRDLDDQFCWSAGYQPTRVAPESYEFQFTSSAAEIARLDREIECRLTVCVAADHDVELRRCRLTNRGSRPRTIELTSYVEFALANHEADINHPTFSKLFVETEIRPRAQAIVARRRPRGADEPERFGFHRLLAGTETLGCGVQFETNRKRFLGRGRSLARPRALDSGAQLTADEGPVLDPIGSLRTVVTLAAGETRDVVFLLGAAIGRDAIEALVVEFGDLEAANEVFAAMEIGEPDSNGDAARWISHPPHDRLESRMRGAVSRHEYLPASEVITEADRADPVTLESLQFDNSLGGFSADGREYVIRLAPDADGQLRLPPQPWVNVIANERAGCIVTERGAGYTWAGNSRNNRLTAWHNDPVLDPHAEALWIRDCEADVYWSPLPGPTPADAPYEVRHGFGYTKFLHESLGLSQEVTIFMAVEDPLKLVRLRLENSGPTPRRLEVFSYLHWNLGTLHVEPTGVSTEFDPALTAILARNPQREEYGNAVAFSAVVAESAAGSLSHTADRETFLGRFGDVAAPEAVVAHERLDNRTGTGMEPCAAWQLPVELPAHGAFECTFLLGEADDAQAAAELIRQFQRAGRVRQELEQVDAFWRESLSGVEVETPSREIDLLVNGWLLYQNLSCRMWGRSAYYQPGGAFGFRDQLQDSSALVYHRPDITRQQILRHASQQFVEGDVLHWWHADSNFGLRTKFSDDLAWLPLVTAGYVATTGDESVLDEVAAFIQGEQLKPGAVEIGIIGTPAGATATVYEHCCLALDRALTVGEHGLPLFGSGDWNDGMNRVGQHGKGESVWLGFFLYMVLAQMTPICERRGDQQRVERYTAERDRLAGVLNDAGWDGQWYRRAYYDDGEPLGSATSDECQIDALAQAWAVLSGVAPPDRAEQAADAVEKRLVDARGGLIRLLTPPFDQTPHDPGYIKGYVPGVRENGGQYTHGVLFFLRALAEMGRGTRAVELLSMLSPVTRAATAERVAIYQTEPYVVAADVYSEPPHVGRGGWTWYTGSAGWMYRVAVESILGFSVEGGRTLVLRPSISANWPSCRLKYRLPDGQTRYEITIENPNGKESGVTAASVDGAAALVVDGAARIELKQDGGTHRVIVRL